MKKILIIEDETDIVTILAFRLKKMKYDVVTASDGQTGLALAKQLRPDLIVLDLTLPELPGEEVCKAIREDVEEPFSKTPIIMVTAKNSDVDRIIGKSIGANSYITKPFELDSLVREINKYLPSEEN